MNFALTDIVFRLLNIAVLIAVAIYVFKRYLLGSIEDTMNEQESLQAGLKQQIGALETELDDLDVEKQWLENHGTFLKKKVDAWKSHFNTFMRNRLSEKKKLQNQSAQRGALQEKIFAQKKLLKTIAPQALLEAEKELTAFYSNSKNADSYITNALKQIQRNNHG